MLAVWHFLEKGDGSEPKHQGVKHPLISCALLHAVVLSTGLCVDGCLAEASEAPLPEAHWAALLLLAYWTMLASLRLRSETGSVSQDLYHLMFSCNYSLLLGAAAVVLRRPALLCAQGVLVAVDQVLWYVDFLGYAATGKFPVKVVGYLFWPQTPLSRKVTCVHHVLFEPLVVLLCAAGPGISVGRGFLIALAQTVTCQLVCRLTTPLEVRGKDGAWCYLNINLCHEAFRDVKVAWIRRYDGRSPEVYLPWMLWIWNAGNLLLFVALALPLLLPLRLLGLPGAHLAY